MTLKELIHEEDIFQTFLNTSNDYTLIAPVDMEQFKKFMVLADNHIDGYTMHQVFKNKAAIRILLQSLNPNIELAVYVIDDRIEDNILRTTCDDYINRFNSGFLKL
ncbi:MAG: hypothetical protein ABIQ40_04700 [Bacteroidia bacterium]